MGRRFITDKAGRFTVDVCVNGNVLNDALERDDTEQVLRCALIAALSVLAEGGPWPHTLLETMAKFMENMRRLLRDEALV